MYQNIYIERGEQWGQDTVHLWDDHLGYRTLPFKNFNYAYKPDKSGKYLSMTGVRLSKVSRWQKDDTNVFESDLPQETRVLTDLYLTEDAPSVGHKVMFFDIEVSMVNGIPKIDNPNNEITSIAYYDSTTEEYTVLVVDNSGKYLNTSANGINTYFYASELDLLYAFIDQYEAIGPTIISGWNSDYFDVPYLHNRIAQQCGRNTAGRLSPIGKLKFSKFRGKWSIAGVSSLDYLDLYKKFTYSQLPNYRLDTVGRIEVKMGKVEYEGSLDELFATDLNKFIEYNLQDVRILVEMERKLKLIELVRGICHLGHVPYEDYGYSSKFLEGTIVTYLHRKNVIVSNKPEGGREMMNDREEEDEEGFAGAYVKEPIPGLYDWVYSLDLQSLYPSIIMSLNISPETKIGMVTNWNVSNHLNEQMTDYMIRGTDDDDEVRLNREMFLKYMHSENLMVSSNGILYNGNKKGIIPEILSQWFAERAEYKGLASKYGKEGNTELAEYYDRRQHIQKIFLNSLYGVLGLPIFRFFDIDNALAVTASGQDIIKRSAAYINTLYRTRLNTDSDYNIYSDTDSLYFSAMPLLPVGKDAKEFTIKLAGVMENKLNDHYTDMARSLFFCKEHRLHIKGESVANTAIWIAKKMYAMNVVYNLEKSIDYEALLANATDDGQREKIKKDMFKVKGLATVRSSFPPSFRFFMNNMMRDVLAKTPKEELDNNVMEFRSQLNTMRYDEIARNSAVKEISKYDIGITTFNKFKKGTPIHAKAALSYNLMLKHFGLDTQYEPITDGEKIIYVYLKRNDFKLDVMALRGYNDPPQVVELVETHLDYNRLFEKELQTKIQDFYTALRWGNLPTKVNKNINEWFG